MDSSRPEDVVTEPICSPPERSEPGRRTWFHRTQEAWRPSGSKPFSIRDERVLRARWATKDASTRNLPLRRSGNFVETAAIFTHLALDPLDFDMVKNLPDLIRVHLADDLDSSCSTTSTSLSDRSKESWLSEVVIDVDANFSYGSHHTLTMPFA